MLQQLISGLEAGSWYALIALAVVVVMKATDVPNFAMADMGVIAAYVAWALEKKGLPLLLAVLVALVFAFVFGAVVQRIVVYPTAAALAAVVGVLVALTPANFAEGAVVGGAVGLAFTFYAERHGFRTLAGGSHFPLLLSTIGIGSILVNSVGPIWGVESHDFDKLWKGRPFELAGAFITRTQIITFVVGLVTAIGLGIFSAPPGACACVPSPRTATWPACSVSHPARCPCWRGASPRSWRRWP